MLNCRHKTLHSSEAKPPPPSAEPRHCRRPPLPLPPSTSLYRSFSSLCGSKIQCNIFCTQKSPKGPHMDPKVEQRRPFGAPRASPDLQKQAKTLVKIDVFTMCIKLALGTIFSPLVPPSGGPSDLKGAQSAKNGLHLGHHFEYFFDLFLSWMQDRPGGGPKGP